jgi:O-antigen/teichoic acid export membrane protein
MTSIAKTLRQTLGIDAAIFYSINTQALAIVRTVSSIFLVSFFLSKDEQGFFYTFSSILGIQVFFDLGMASIISQYAAHEHVHLTNDTANTITPQNQYYISRLSSLLYLSVKWFLVSSVCLFVSLWVFGNLFFGYFSSDNYSGIDWQQSWLLLSLSTCLLLCFSPLTSFYEGIGKIDKVAKLRFYALLSQIVFFIVSICLGARLYSLAISNLAGVACYITWMLKKDTSKVFLFFWRISPKEDIISWKREIFPYQWRVAISWMSGYLLFQLFSPILFATSGAVEAGRMGMTQSSVNGLFSISNSWLTTKVPIFSGFIAKKDFETLDRLFNFSIKRALVICGIGGVLLFLTILLFEQHIPVFSGRFLTGQPLILLIASSVLLLYTSALATYLRCHKKEPFMWLSLISGCVNAFMLYFTSKHYGIKGMITAYCIITLISAIIGRLIFLRKKKLWH